MKRKNRPLKIFCLLIIIIALIVGIILFSLYFFVRKNIDFKKDEELFRSARSFEATRFFANGSLEADNYSPILIETAGSPKKLYVPLSEVPEVLKDGFIAVEDRRFFEHSGVDYKRTLLAVFNYIFKKDKIFGASTITQQVIKNISGDSEVSLKRKMSEILRATHIEKKFSKNEILELYLNVIPMSEGIYGVKEAARIYFGKTVSELSVEEAATLIGITNAPSAYNPYSNPKKCKEKRDSVLKIMY